MSNRLSSAAERHGLDLWLPRLSPFVPYLAVGIGLFGFHNAWAAMISYHAVAAMLGRFSKQRPPLAQILKNNRPAGLAFSLILGAAAGVALFFLWPYLSVRPAIGLYLASIGLTSTSWPLFIAYYVIVNPVVEEYFWRGCLGDNAGRPVINDFLFAGYHWLVLAGIIGTGWLAPVFLLLAGAAFFWRQMTRMTGGLLSAVVSHAAADASIILSVYFLVSAS